VTLLRRAALAVLAAVAIGAPLAVVAPAAPARADQVRALEYWLDDYGIADAWATTRGAGQTIAIIDSGVDRTHPDLAGAVTGGTDVSGLGGDGSPTGSEDAHGTLVASLAAGRGSAPGTGVIGAAPAASLLSVSVGFDGAGDSDEQIARAVRYAVDQGATVINMSLTRNTRDWPESWDEAFLYAAERDVVVVAAAGNRGSGTEEVGAPATMPGVLTVAGVDRSGAVSADASSQGITIGVSAPSEDLVGALPGGGHATWSGTSGAAPIVSGIVALVRAAHPELDAANVINRLVATARDAGPAGVDVTYGFGLVDAAAAVTSDVPAVSANPMGDLADWVRVHRRAASADAPAPTGEPTAAPAPVATAPAEPDAVAVGVYYPSVNQLRDTGLPLLVLLGLVAALAVWGVRTARRYAGVRRAR